MRVLVTLSNILEYGLDTITGNTREDLLARAAEMEANGYEMFVNLPDIMGGEQEAPTERNVFDHFNSELPEPDGAVHSQTALNLTNYPQPIVPCSYAYRYLVENNEHKWICLLHDSPSKHPIEPGSSEPCLVIDPYGHDWEL
jgi:hypothetical protein